MNRLRSILRNVWRHDSRPVSDIPSRVKVGVQRESALLTLKYCLRWSVRFGDMTAFTTPFGGVSRVYENYRDTGKRGFVLNVLAKLCKRPTMQRSSLRPFRPNPLPDALKLLEGNGSLCALSRFYDAFCNNVVCVAGKAGLTTRAASKLALSRACAFFLQLGSKATVTVPDALNVRSAHLFAVGSACDVIDAEVYAQNTLNIVGRRCLDFAGCEKIERPTHEGKVTFALLRLQQLPLAFAACKGNIGAPVNRPDRHNTLRQLVTQYPAVIADCAQRLKGALGFFVQFVGVSNFRDAADDDLSRKREGFFDMTVNEFLKPELAERARIPSNFRDIVTRLVSPFHRLFQCRSLFGCRQEFQLGDELHRDSIAFSSILERSDGYPISAYGRPLIPPRIKIQGILSGSL